MGCCTMGDARERNKDRKSEIMETNGVQKSIALWIGLVTTSAGGLTVLISVVVLSQPVSEQNLWTLYAIPYLIVVVVYL